MHAKGTVTQINGNKALIIVDRPTTCGGSCANCSGNCTITNNSIEAENPLGAKVGDYVVIETETKSVLFSAFLVYILPVIFLCLGYFIAEYMGLEEAGSMICGFILFIFTFLCLHLYDKKRKKSINSKIIEII